jgi:hypothetical protein
MGNNSGGTTLLHLSSPVSCSEPGCAAQAYLEAVETAWPTILAVLLPVTNTFKGLDEQHSVKTGLSIIFSGDLTTNGDVIYNLISCIMHKPNHWMAAVHIGDSAYRYNDMQNQARCHCLDHVILLRSMQTMRGLSCSVEVLWHRCVQM